MIEIGSGQRERAVCIARNGRRCRFVDYQRKLDGPHQRLLSEGGEKIAMPADVEIDIGIAKRNCALRRRERENILRNGRKFLGKYNEPAAGILERPDGECQRGMRQAIAQRLRQGRANKQASRNGFQRGKQVGDGPLRSALTDDSRIKAEQIDDVRADDVWLPEQAQSVFRFKLEPVFPRVEPEIFDGAKFAAEF